MKIWMFTKLTVVIISQYMYVSVSAYICNLLTLYRPWNSPGQNTGVGSCCLLQGIFPTQESNPGLPHCRQILYQLSHQETLSSLKLVFIELTMPSNHLILCCPLLQLPSIFPCIRVFSNEWALYIRWPKYWSFSISMLMSIQDCFPSGLTGLIFLLSKGFSRVFSSTTVQKDQFFGTQSSLWSNSHICTRLLEKP